MTARSGTSRERERARCFFLRKRWGEGQQVGLDRHRDLSSRGKEGEAEILTSGNEVFLI